jgi:phage antirepressor YoqD-like protein
MSLHPVVIPTLEAPLVTTTAGEARTSTLVIAYGTDNDHASVFKLVKNYQSDLEEFGILGFEIQKSGNAGRPLEYALLNEQQATLIMTYMRNSDIVRTFKKQLVKAFYELAHAATDPMALLNDPYALRTLVLSYSEKVIQRDKLIALIQPKAAALDRLATADGSICITNTAKDLQMRPKDLFAYLSSHKWIYRRTGGIGWIAYQDKLQQGLLEHKITTVERSDGTEKMTEQVLVTAKGMTRLAEIFQTPPARVVGGVA